MFRSLPCRVLGSQKVSGSHRDVWTAECRDAITESLEVIQTSSKQSLWKSQRCPRSASLVSAHMSTSDQATKLREILENQIDNYFAVKQCRVSNSDKLWGTKDIKKLDRWKKVEYRKHGKSTKYLYLLKAYNSKCKTAAQLSLQRNVSDLMEPAPGKAWATLKKMGAQPGECGGEEAFTLTDHLEQNLTLDQSIERIL